ncbi:MAG: sulfatase [Prolixibacteraceae bacterium]|nr:sulfatase [Prolixibacteraceae bacterium]
MTEKFHKTDITGKVIFSKKIFFFLAFYAIVFAGCSGKTEKPNVIIFFTDDQGYADVGCFGAEGFTTPNFDQMAAGGIRFTNFYVPATVCTPSRAGILTGQYPKRSNLHEAVLFPYSTGGLSTDKFTMAEMFRENGYSTTCIGKWHLGHLPEFMPGRHGFDHFYGVPYSNDMDRHYYRNIDFQSPPLPLYKNENLIEEGPDQKYLTKRYTEEVIRIIKDRGDSPFFIYMAHNMPHTPLHVSEKFKGKSERGLYGDVIMELDWSMGEIVKTLKEEGIYENTIVIFTSDNGPVPLQSAKPLRGKKATTWEGGQRVPCIMSWPGKIPAGITSDEMVLSMDLFPTFIDITGAKLSAPVKFDGISIRELLENPARVKLPDRPLLYYARNGKPEAIRYGNWKLHITKTLGWNMDEEGEFPVSLYDLKDDIGEKNNVAGDNPEVVEKLKKMLTDIDAEISIQR